MSEKIEVIAVRQVDGGVRRLAVSAADRAAVRRDPAMIECVTVLGAVDVASDGTRRVGPIGPLWRDVPQHVRDLLA